MASSLFFFLILSIYLFIFFLPFYTCIFKIYTLHITTKMQKMKLLVIERHEISTLPVTKICGFKDGPQRLAYQIIWHHCGLMVPNCLKSNSITNYAVVIFFSRQLKHFFDK